MTGSDLLKRVRREKKNENPCGCPSSPHRYCESPRDGSSDPPSRPEHTGCCRTGSGVVVVVVVVPPPVVAFVGFSPHACTFSGYLTSWFDVWGGA